MNIKAIETKAFGCRFRSRLEARWATFFESTGVRWYYELEGYKLRTGCYLPDFYLPELSLHVEVKPDGVCEHAIAFRDDVGPIVVTHGLPGEGLSFYGYDLADSSGGASEWFEHECQFNFDDQRKLCLFIDGGQRVFCTMQWDGLDRVLSGDPSRLSMSTHFAKAKEARFGR